MLARPSSRHRPSVIPQTLTRPKASARAASAGSSDRISEDPTRKASANGAEPLDVGAARDSRFGDHEIARGNQGGKPLGGGEVDLHVARGRRLLIPMRSAPSADRARAPRPRHAPRRARPCRAGGASPSPPPPPRREAPPGSPAPRRRREAGPRRPGRGSTMKSLARIGPRNSAPDRPQIVERPAEIGRVGEHADRVGRAAIGAGDGARRRLAGRIAPREGEPRFTSRMKRAPGRASAALRLRRVGCRREGSRPKPVEPRRHVGALARDDFGEDAAGLSHWSPRRTA